MIVFPNAKINLGLQILRKRKDAYHDIRTIMYPIPWCDALECIASEKKMEYSFSGLAIPGNAKDNLCLKAYEILRKDYNLPNVKIHLHKVIPFGAGLGGGSSDAAFMLKLLSQSFDLFLSDDLLEIYASQIGSDCPFFIKNKPALAEGIGDELQPIALNLKGYYLKLIYPGIVVNTAKAYHGCQANEQVPDLREIIQLPVSQWKNHLFNQFEETVFAQYPTIAEIKNRLYKHGSLYASMSGSGSAVFALYEEKPEAMDLSDFPEAVVFITQL